MALPEFQSNFVKLPKALIDDDYIATLSPTALQVLLVILRLTEGFQRQRVRVSQSTIAEKLGKSRKAVCESLQELREADLVLWTRESQECCYELAVGSCNPEVTSKKQDMSPQGDNPCNPEVTSDGSTLFSSIDKKIDNKTRARKEKQTPSNPQADCEDVTKFLVSVAESREARCSDFSDAQRRQLEDLDSPAWREKILESAFSIPPRTDARPYFLRFAHLPDKDPKPPPQKRLFQRPQRAAWNNPPQTTYQGPSAPPARRNPANQPNRHRYGDPEFWLELCRAEGIE